MNVANANCAVYIKHRKDTGSERYAERYGVRSRFLTLFANLAITDYSAVWLEYNKNWIAQSSRAMTEMLRLEIFPQPLF